MTRWPRRSLLLAVLPGLIAASGPAAGEQDLPAVGREIVDTVRRDFWNPETAERWAARHAGYADEIADRAAFVRQTRRRLAELETSHTAYYTPDDRAYWDLLAIFQGMLGDPEGGRDRPVEIDSVGLAVRPGPEGREGTWFVERVFPGGPAAEAGVLRGDRPLTVDGEPFHPVHSLRGRAGEALELELERRPGERLRRTVTPQTVDPLAEWRRAQEDGTRIVRRGTGEGGAIRVGYVPLWACVGDTLELLGEALAGALQDADALVLDLRGGWGGCNPEMLHLFNPTAPTLTRITREGERLVWGPSWKKPLVVLIDGGSRSGKEVVARAIQRHGLGVLVGERTAGAVIAGRPYLLSDGSLLYLAVQDFLTDGERLEGIGVTPEVEVAAPLPWAAGADPQLDRAFEVAVERVRAAATPAPSP